MPRTATMMGSAGSRIAPRTYTMIASSRIPRATVQPIFRTFLISGFSMPFIALSSGIGTWSCAVAAWKCCSTAGWVLADSVWELGQAVAAEAARLGEGLEAARKPGSFLRSSTRISRAGSASPLPMPSSPATWLVFVTGYGDDGLPAYRDRPTLRKSFQIDAPKRALQERLGDRVVTSVLPRVGTARRERGVG